MTITSVTPIGSLTPSARQVAGAAVERPRQSGENPQAAEAVANVPREQLESAVASMQSAMQSIRRDINFRSTTAPAGWWCRSSMAVPAKWFGRFPPRWP